MDKLREEGSDLVPPAPVTAANVEALEYIDGAILDIVDSWSMRNSTPDGACLMSALAALRTARDALVPRAGAMTNRGAS